MSLATLRPPPKPAPEPMIGVCRVCGCTDQEACVTWASAIDGTATATCSWVERDLCSRCHSPRRPTRPQAAELARIRSRTGPYRLAGGRYPGELVVTLLEPAPANYAVAWQAKRELRMGPDGHIYTTRARGRELVREQRKVDAGQVLEAERTLEL